MVQIILENDNSPIPRQEAPPHIKEWREKFISVYYRNYGGYNEFEQEIEDRLIEFENEIIGRKAEGG